MSHEFWQQHEPLLLEFESVRRSDNSVSIDQFLESMVDVPARDRLVAQLVMIDFEVDYENDRTTNLDNWFRRFPALADKPQIRRQMLKDEFEIRSKFDDLPGTAEMQSRFDGDPIATEVLQSVRASSVHKTDGPDGAAMAILPPGTLVDHYEIEQCIGRGAFAIVYAAKETQLNRLVALKFLHASQELHPELHARMLREAQALAQLSHPNIVAIYQIGSHGGFDYIASQFIAGRTLEEKLKNESPPIFESVSIISKLAQALDYVHHAGVVHRDIKPANIMLDNGEPLLLDFGLALLVDSTHQLTRDGDLVGTPAFMAPEQADGRAWQADPRSDVYSLGAVLYQMVCGRRPFEGTVASVVNQLLKDEPPPPRQFNREVSRELETIILKCLEKEPSSRYSSAVALAADLQNYLDGKPIEARSIGMLGRHIKWCRRRPIVAMLLAGLLLLAMFLGGAATQLRRVAKQRDRALIAEQATAELLSRSCFDTGILAMQRGQVQNAITNFKLAIQNGYEDRDEVNLKLVEAFFVQRKFDSARSALNEVQLDDAESRGQIALWNAELAQPADGEHDWLMEAVEQLPAGADRSFALGRQAKSTLIAIKHFRQALASEAFHYRARRGLILSLLSLARFEEASIELQIARQLFPESEDLILLDALCQSGIGATDNALELIEASKLTDDLKTRWNSFCHFVFETRNKAIIGTKSADLDARLLISLSNEFYVKFLPLICERNWTLSGPVVEKLKAFKNELENFESQDQTAGPVSELYELAEIHPEATLKVVAGNHGISTVSTTNSNAGEEKPAKQFQIERIESARLHFQSALESESLVSDTRMIAWKGVYVSSVLLAMIHRHDVEHNHRILLQASKEIDEQSISRIGALRSFSLTALTVRDHGEAERWIKRWIEVSNPEEHLLIDALLHRAVLNRRRQQWLQVRNDCLKIVEINPDFANAQEMLEIANSEIQRIANE